jgi:hypothetical protein
MPPASAARHQQIVGPFEIDTKSRDGVHRLSQRNAGREWQYRRRALSIDARARRRQHNRHVEAAPRRREPRVSAPAAARRLLVGDDDGAFAVAGPGDRRRDVVGGRNRRKKYDRRAQAAESMAGPLERFGKFAW